MICPSSITIFEVVGEGFECTDLPADPVDFFEDSLPVFKSYNPPGDGVDTPS